MHWLYPVTLLVALLLSVQSSEPARAQAGQRVAMVVGIANYAHWPKLENPLRDARAVGQMLRDLGFEVSLVENVDRGDLVRELGSFQDRADRAAIAVFYFAGHGMQIEGRNYLIPKDAPASGSVLGMEDWSVRVDRVAAAARDGSRGASDAFIFLDACRTSPPQGLQSRTRGTVTPGFSDRGLERISSGPRAGGILISFASAANSVADDGPRGGHSPYASALLKHLPTPNLSVQSALIRVRQAVKQATADQEPWVSDSVDHEVFLSGTADLSAGKRIKLHGSETIGSQLVPDLTNAFAAARGLVLHKDVQLGTAAREIVFRTPTGSDELTFEVHSRGSDTAFPALRTGAADIGMSSRPVDDREWEAHRREKREDLRAQGVAEHVVALDGVAVVVPLANSITALRSDQIAGAFSGKVMNWRSLGGLEQSISLHARNEDSGTLDIFRTLVLNPARVLLSPHAVRYDSSTELSMAVSRDLSGIGFVSLTYAHPARPVAIASYACPDLIHQPTTFNVKTEEYPFVRRLFFYTSDKPAAGPVKDFVAYVLSTEGQAVVSRSGFVDLQVDADFRPVSATAPAPGVRPRREAQMLNELAWETAGARRLSVTFRFQTASDELDSRAREDLQRLARYAQTLTASGGRLFLVGFADGRGGFEGNLALSQARADRLLRELGQVLRSRGANGPALLAKGYSTLSPVACDGDPGGTNLNRRVEVWVR